MKGSVIASIESLWGGYDDEQSKQDYLATYNDGLAIFAIVVLFLTIAGILSFICYVSYQKEVDERNHPFHQQYEQHQIDKKEKEDQDELVREIEWTSGVDFQAYTCAWDIFL